MYIDTIRKATTRETGMERNIVFYDEKMYEQILTDIYHW
jgi:hypothetical protein